MGRKNSRRKKKKKLKKLEEYRLEMNAFAQFLREKYAGENIKILIIDFILIYVIIKISKQRHGVVAIEPSKL